MRWIRRFSTLVVFVLMLGLLVASQTIGVVASATSSVIRAVAGVATVFNPALGRKKLPLRAAGQAELRKSRKAIAVLERENAALRRSARVTFRGEKLTAKAATRRVIKSVERRTKRLAATNLSSIAGESIPFIGVAIIVAATGYEIKSSCDSMKELHDLDLALNPDAVEDTSHQYVCGLKAPTKGEIWAQVKSSPSVVWHAAVSALKTAGGKVSNIPTPNFSGWWSTIMRWGDNLF